MSTTKRPTVSTAQVTSLIILQFVVFSCTADNHRKAFEVFNEGVSLNLKAGDEEKNGNYQLSREFNRRSSAKFRETLELDSTHPIARSALAHSYYMDRKYQEAISWFENARQRHGDVAADLRELGLSRIMIGQLPEGTADIDRAFQLDTSMEIREITIADLVISAREIRSAGEEYVNGGDDVKGKEYLIYSTGVLITAFQYDESKGDIALMIAEYARRVGDDATSLKYEALAKK